MGFFDLFREKKVYEGEIVDLRERYRVSAKQAYDGIATVYYEILKHEDKHKVGTIDLRLSAAQGDMYYYGNVGYNVQKEERGNSYAYYACKVLFRIAKEEFGMHELIITCSPENEASYRTLMKLNGELLELVEVPARHLLYTLGEKTKYIFRYRIDL
ncbi:MAG: GNAT family N-acetyltransferase [Erysipelotrichaceae bacterium]|nr:GNAT family N-acetyltransferase [Erysipelotrichaceae bacterium]